MADVMNLDIFDIHYQSKKGTKVWNDLSTKVITDYQHFWDLGQADALNSESLKNAHWEDKEQNCDFPNI